MACSICLEDFKSEKNNDITYMTCNHMFHKKCLKRWLKHDKKYDLYTGSCPLCRQIGFDDTEFKTKPSITRIIGYNIIRFFK